MNTASNLRVQAAAIFGAALLVAEIVAAKATRDALFLSTFGAALLPRAMLGAAALSLLAAIGVSALMRRFGPGRATTALLLVSASLFAAEAILLPRIPALVIVAVYLQLASFSATAISGFWTTVTDHFDPYSARKVVARAATAAPIGGLLGGLSAAPILEIWGPRVLLASLGMLQVAAAALVVLLSSRRPVARTVAGPSNGFAVVASSGYLQKLAWTVALTALVGTLLDYVLKARAASHLANTQALLSFFGTFYTVTSIGAALVQFGVTRRALELFGLGGTLAVLPGFVIPTAAIAILVPELWPVVLLRGGANVLENSAFRSAYEPLYTPVADEKKHAAKTIIDVASERLGDALGAGLVLMLAAFLPAQVELTALSGATLAAIAALVLALALHRGYVRELARSLRSGLVQLSQKDVHDRTTRITLSQTLAELDRETLLKQIAELQARKQDERGEPARLSRPRVIPETVQIAPSGEARALLDSAQALVSGDPEQIRRVLKVRLDSRLIALVIPLLGRDDLAELALSSLSEAAARAPGVLADHLLDPEQPTKIRRRIARVLGQVGNERAADALCLALGDQQFAVRYQAALALRAIAERSSYRPPSMLLFDTVRREVELGVLSQVAEDSQNISDDDVRDPEAPSRGLKHVFTLLSLAVDREPVELSLRALASGDQKLRGTALEYLENVLPIPVRQTLWPHLGADRFAKLATRRPREQIVDDLKRSLDGLQLPREQLRPRVK